MEDLQKKLTGYFEWFHRHPELSKKEFQTTARIREILVENGIDEISDAGLSAGLVAVLRGKQGGKTVALRADIDALPITETTGLPYASENPGVMHACGHDFHLTGLLGAAILLAAEREKLNGNIYLVFQCAEESSDAITGARELLSAGLLDGVHEIYGLHTAPALEPGVVAIGPGALYSSVSYFRILIKGKGGHAAMPHLAADPVTALAALISQAQTVVSRNTDPFEAVALSITHVEAGTAYNVIPGEAMLEGTIRAQSTEGCKKAAAQLKRVSDGTAVSAGLSIDFQWNLMLPAMNNNAELCGFVSQVAAEEGFTVVPAVPILGGEDFSLYLERIPGVFFNFGVGSPQGLHNPGFIADTSHLAGASRLLAAIGRKALERRAG
jgi:amidohydrolase